MRAHARRLAVVVALAVGLALVRPPVSEGQTGGARGSQAEATAIVSQVAPGVGSLSLTSSAGVALAKLTNRVAQAQSKTLDLGLVGNLIVSLGDVDSSQLPQPLTVDNRAGDARAAEVDAPIFGGIGGGSKAVEATTEPRASATSTAASAVGDLVQISGGRAEASTTQVDATTREARAAVTADLDLAGIVRLSGMRWEARHRTGDQSARSATFEVARASIGSAEVPTDSLEVLGVLVNSALSFTGISIQLPRVEHIEGTTDRIRITELGIQLKDSPAGAAALGPLLDLTRDQRRQLYDQVTAEFGEAALPLLVADVGTSIVSGQGFVKVAVGGAEASSGDLVLEDLLGGESPSVADPPSPSITVDEPTTLR
jgi:hypothetical protein